MVLRWEVTALMEAEKNFRRVRGYLEMTTFDAVLKARVAAKIDKTTSVPDNQELTVALSTDDGTSSSGSEGQGSSVSLHPQP